MKMINLRKPLSKEIKSKLSKNTIKLSNGILKLNDILNKQDEEEKELITNAGKCEKWNGAYKNRKIW